ncbi:MAG: hypothetical protein ACPF8V_08665 [Luteibaculum sp.]
MIPTKNIRLIALAFLLVASSCSKEETDIPLNPEKDYAPLIINQCDDGSKTLQRIDAQNNAIDFDIDGDGIRDFGLELIADDAKADNNTNDALKAILYNSAWELPYQVYEERTFFCNNAANRKGSVSYKSNQQQITCNGSGSEQLKKRLFVARNADAKNLDEGVWNQIVLTLAETVNQMNEKQNYAQHYFSGHWYGNTGVLHLRNQNTGEIKAIELCVPLAYVEENGVRKYRIDQVSIYH